MEHWINQLKNWLQEKSLIRVVYLESKKLPQCLLGRVLQVDEEKCSFLLYSDDQKSVKNVSFNEVDSIEKVYDAVHSA